MGRFREVRTHQLQFIDVKPRQEVSSISHTSLPLCTFQHEVLLTNGIGNPRWRVRPWLNAADDASLRGNWYDDNYSWGNDICRDGPMTSFEEVLDAFDKKGISRIILVGDSLSGSMWADFDDIFRNCTQGWMKRNPVRELNKTIWWDKWAIATNWDEMCSSYGAFGNATSDCIHHASKRACCKLNTCTNRSLVVHIGKFLPGHWSPREPDFNMPAITRTVEQYEELFYEKYIKRFAVPSSTVVVFNTGLWLINAYRENSVVELRHMLNGFLNVCQREKILFVWRSTFYNHIAINTVDDLIRATNEAAVQLLTLRKHPFFVGSNHEMSRMRPDRTCDGFHYTYRKKYGEKWRQCKPSDMFSLIDDGCIRDSDWPQSVSRAATLHLINLLLNT
jgi:hypothetical protein